MLTNSSLIKYNSGQVWFCFVSRHVSLGLKKKRTSLPCHGIIMPGPCHNNALLVSERMLEAMCMCRVVSPTDVKHRSTTTTTTYTDSFSLSPLSSTHLSLCPPAGSIRHRGRTNNGRSACVSLLGSRKAASPFAGENRSHFLQFPLLSLL